MTLIKTSVLNGIAVVIRALTLLGINKILAIYIGPSGYATLGQFQNATQIIVTLASGAINTGVTKYTAEYQEDKQYQRLLWRTAGTIALIGSLAMSTLVVLLSKPLSAWFLGSESFREAFIWFGATLSFFVINALFLAIINGKKEIGRYVVANIGGSLFALAVTGPIVASYGLLGALIALAVIQPLSFAITFSLCYRAPWFRILHFFGRIDRHIAINLAKYAVMALTTATCVPICHILIRNHLGGKFGWEAAGYWEAMWRVSGAYLMLITTTLSVYYLPRLSEIKETLELRKEVVRGYVFVLPVAALSGLVIYIFRDFIISTLLTRDFEPMRDLFAWQMTGDTLKMGSWILSWVMLGRAMFGLYILTEVAFSISFVALTVVFTNVSGLVGVTWAHAANYLLYWIVIFLAIRKKVFLSSPVVPVKDVRIPS